MVITVKGVRLALPTDEASLFEFKFLPLPYDYRARIPLGEIINKPDRARRLFNEWDDVFVIHVFDPTYGTEFSPGRTPKYARTKPSYLSAGSYRFLIGPKVHRRCSTSHKNAQFVYGNITAPQRDPPFDRTNYKACAGDNVEVSYSWLRARDWTHDTLPIFQKNITELFNAILLDRSVAVYEFDRRACEEVLNSPEMQNIEAYIDEHHAAVHDFINEKLAGLDCQYGQLRRYLDQQNFVIDQMGESSDGYYIRIYYYSSKKDFISKLFGRKLGGLFVFDEDRKFTYANWGVPK